MALYRESYIFRIETDEPGMFWTGVGDLLLPADDVLDAPALVLGGGGIINLPDLEQLINGLAQRADIILSGVAQSTLAYALEEAPQVPGATVYIGRIKFDESWQQAEPVEWEWTGEGVNLSVDSQDGDPRTRRLTLRLAAGETTRQRAPNAFFTDADQTRDYPDDPVFAYVAGINQGTSRRWGPAT